MDGPNFFELIGAIAFGLSALRAVADVGEGLAVRGAPPPPFSLFLGSCSGLASFVLAVKGQDQFHLLHPGHWAMLASSLLFFARHLSLEAKVSRRVLGFLCAAATLPFGCLAALGFSTAGSPHCMVVYVTLLTLAFLPLPYLFMRWRNHDSGDDSDDEDEDQNDMRGNKRRLFTVFFTSFFYIFLGAPARQCSQSAAPGADSFAAAFEVAIVALANGWF
jgi:hypothetical protein